MHGSRTLCCRTSSYDDLGVQSESNGRRCRTSRRLILARARCSVGWLCTILTYITCHVGPNCCMHRFLSTRGARVSSSWLSGLWQTSCLSHVLSRASHHACSIVVSCACSSSCCRLRSSLWALAHRCDNGPISALQSYDSSRTCSPGRSPHWRSSFHRARQAIRSSCTSRSSSCSS